MSKPVFCENKKKINLLSAVIYNCHILYVRIIQTLTSMYSCADFSITYSMQKSIVRFYCGGLYIILANRKSYELSPITSL